MTLSKEGGEACSATAMLLTEQEQQTRLSELDDWQIVMNNKVPQLQKVYRFKDFATALAFTQRVGDMAEQADHHPALLTEWGKVTVRWWSHDRGGLHPNDFRLAARTDDCYEQPLRP